ncbi:MAG: hypothetical protein ACFCGT_21215 [Sandaracinaceae bacterium]
MGSLTAGCGTSSSAYATTATPVEAYRGEVDVRSIDAPAGGVELGVVEVRSVQGLDRAVAEFKARVAQLGGNVGVVESHDHTIERQEDQVIVTLDLLGRAYRTGAVP